jgi:hypothetical protein
MVELYNWPMVTGEGKHIYHVEFDIEVDTLASDKQAIEWIRFMIGDTGKISNENPMYEKSFDPKFGTIKIEQRFG